MGNSTFQPEIHFTPQLRRRRPHDVENSTQLKVPTLFFRLASCVATNEAYDDALNELPLKELFACFLSAIQPGCFSALDLLD
jgi:hypothetical protein